MADDVDDSGEFLGVPTAALRALGCLMVAAGRLESTIRIVLADLYVHPGTRQAGDALREIRRAVRRGLPDHARLDPEELTEWTLQVRDALEERHVPTHSAAAKRYDGRSWVPVGMHLRSRTEWPMEGDDLMTTANELADLARAGMELDFALRHSPRLGVFLPNTVVDGTWVPTCSTDIGGAELARPTAEELDEWWGSLGPFPEIRP